jgi:8-amino-7-oxononanoate synthase
MNMLDDLLTKALHMRESQGALRQLKLVKPSLIDFSSNDYLGLARSAELKKAIAQRYQSLSSSLNGATGSRLLSGNSAYIEEVEKELAVIFKSEACLIFNSGYTANLAVLSSLAKRGDTILYDELSHASIKDGLRLSQATRFHFHHNDVNDLESKLRKAQGNCFVIVESIYSMDGDSSPLETIVNLCERYSAYLMLDEAHSTGVVGEAGNGLACELNLQSKIPVRIYTFGKAMGIHGACVTGSKQLISFLVNFARPFIYTTAPDNHSITSISSAFSFLKATPQIPVDLKNKTEFFLSLMMHNKNLLDSTSAIQSFIIPGNREVKTASEQLQQAGLDVRPILSPTVAKGTERLRIILHSFNTNSEIENLALQLQALSSRI